MPRPTIKSQVVRANGRAGSSHRSRMSPRAAAQWAKTDFFRSNHSRVNFSPILMIFLKIAGEILYRSLQADFLILVMARLHINANTKKFVYDDHVIMLTA